jgi:hypothetical protein
MYSWYGDDKLVFYWSAIPLVVKLRFWNLIDRVGNAFRFAVAKGIAQGGGFGFSVSKKATAKVDSRRRGDDKHRGGSGGSGVSHGIRMIF